MTSVAAATRGPVERWSGAQIQVLAILLLVVASNYVDRSILGVLQEPVKHDLRLTDYQLGLVGGPAFAVFYALAGIPTARWAERTNRARVLPLLLSTWSLMAALCGLAVNFTTLALARAGVGLGEGGCIPISHSLVSEHFSPRQRGKAIAVLACGTAIGAFLAASIGSVIAQTWSWRVAFMAVGLPGLVLAFVVRAKVTDPHVHAREGARDVFADVRQLFKRKVIFLLIAANGLASIGNSGYLLFTASYFLRTYNLSMVQVGAIYATGIGLAGIVGSLLSGVLADAFAGGRGRSYAVVPTVGLGLAAILFALAFTRGTWWMAAGCLVGAYMMQDMKAPSLAAVQTLAPPGIRATAAAVLYLVITFCGSGFGGPITGAVSDMVASGALPKAWGAVAHACPGGRAPPGTGAAVAMACRHATALGVRAGLLTSAGFTAAAAVLFFLSSLVIDLPLTKADPPETP